MIAVARGATHALHGWPGWPARFDCEAKDSAAVGRSRRIISQTGSYVPARRLRNIVSKRTALLPKPV